MIDDDNFMGYKCPFFQCDIIVPTHELCEGIRRRLDAIADKKFEPTEEEFLNTLDFNFKQFVIKTFGNFESRTI